MSETHRILVRRSGEVATKARVTRSRFETRLLRNLRDALASENVQAELRRTHDRIFVESGDRTALAPLSRVFGVRSLSLATVRPAPDVQEVARAGAELFTEAVRGRRFAVRARRVGERRRVTVDPRALERELGAALDRVAARVDLERPEVTVSVELHEGVADFFTERVEGPGGLPLGVEGRAAALVSGGFDSAVAAWQMQRRGVSLDYVFCNLGGISHRLGTLRVMKVLADQWSYGLRPRLHAIDFSEVTEALRKRTEARYWQVLLKRLMLRAAEAVARERRASAVVTGEAVGQVSSQTLPNLAAISQATELPILRPLVGSNKEEIIAQAERIGTAALSAVVGEYCAMVPRRPATAARLADLLAEESHLEPALLEKAVAQREVLDLRSLEVESLGPPNLDVHEIPSDATVVDLRSAAAYRGWHYPGALYLDFPRALASYPSFSRDTTYVLYCEFGLKSAHLAERMQQEGFRAYHVPGGLKQLLRLARERGIETPERPGGSEIEG